MTYQYLCFIMRDIVFYALPSFAIITSAEIYNNEMKPLDFFTSHSDYLSNRNVEVHDHNEHGETDVQTKYKPWGKVIGFTFLINMATLSGVLIFIPVISRKVRAWANSFCWDEAVPVPAPEPQDCHHANETKREQDSKRNLDIIIPSFASGALLATSIFLVIPEAIYLIQKHLNDHGSKEEKGETEKEHSESVADEFGPGAIWRFGVSLLVGFVFPMVLDVIFPRMKKDHFDGDECTRPVEVVQGDEFGDICREENTSNSTTHTSCKEEKIDDDKRINYSLVLSIIIGDAMHNFCDGVFVGVALLICDNNTAYTIIAITLYHEVAQEVADYFLLTKHAGLRPFTALLLNFCSGLSVVLGGIVVLPSPVSDLGIGMVLSVAAGVYLNISTCESLPRVSEVVQTRKNRILSIVFFIVGVVPIGLALLNHSHCHKDH